jgi:MFS family permease
MDVRNRRRWDLSSYDKQYMFVTLSVAFTIHMLGPYYPSYLYCAGLTTALLGIFRSISQVFTAIFDFPTGAFADKYGRRNSGCIGLILNGIGFSSIIFFPKFGIYPLIVGFVCIGLGDAFLSGSFEAWITDSYKKEGVLDKLKFLFSKVRMLVPVVGVGAGALGSLLSSINLAAPIIAGCFVLFFASVFALMVMKENYGANVASTEHLKTSLSYLLAFKNLQLYTLGFLLCSCMFQFFIFTWPIILITRGLTKEMLGILYILFLIVMSSGALISNILLKKYSFKTLIYIALIIFSFAFLLIGVSSFLFYSIIGLMTLEFAWGLLTPNLIYWRNLLIPSEHRASLLSLISTLSSFASAIIITSLSIYIIPTSLFLAYTSVFFLGIISLIAFILCK